MFPLPLASHKLRIQLHNVVWWSYHIRGWKLQKSFPSRCRSPSSLDSTMLKVVSYSFMYWYMCPLDASHRCLVVNKGCRLSPSTSVACIHRTVVGIHHMHTHRLVVLSLAYIALTVRIHCKILLLIHRTQRVAYLGVARICRERHVSHDAV